MQIQREFRVFRKDVRPGRLLFLATCPFVDAEQSGMNLFKQARCVLRRWVACVLNIYT